MTAATETTTNDRPRVSVPTAIALLLITAVWAFGAVWSFEEQTHLAEDLGFEIPELLPLTLDGMAVAMAAVALAASLDARPAVYARLITAVAIGASAASNASAAWRRSDGDEQTVILAAGVAVAAMFAFEVLLGEVRRQVLRRRGQPGPVAIVYPRIVRLLLSPWPTFTAWRRLVLDATDPGRDFDHRPPIQATATVVDEDDPGVQACRQLAREMAAARQSIAPRIARVALAEHALHWSAVADRPPLQATAPALAVAAPERRALPATATPASAAEPTVAATPEPTANAATATSRIARSVAARATAKRPTVAAKVGRKTTARPAAKAATAGTEADRAATAYAELLAELGRPPSGRQIAARAGISKTFANDWKRDHAPTVATPATTTAPTTEED